MWGIIRWVLASIILAAVTQIAQRNRRLGAFILTFPALSIIAISRVEPRGSTSLGGMKISQISDIRWKSPKWSRMVEGGYETLPSTTTVAEIAINRRLARLYRDLQANLSRADIAPLVIERYSISY